MICIIGVGLYLSCRTSLLQIRKFPYAIKTTIGRMFNKRKASDGALTPFQAVCTALAATVGTGNVAGVAGAIAIGGPGAVFWMWVSARSWYVYQVLPRLLWLSHFRETEQGRGSWWAVLCTTLRTALEKHWQSGWHVLFSAFGVLTVFGTGNATQVNTITTAVRLCST